MQEITVFEESHRLLDEARERVKSLRRSKTNPNDIKTRDGKGGQTWKYVTRLTAMKWLDENYPLWSWEFDLNTFKQHGESFIGSGSLTVIDSVTGFKRIITTVGEEEIIFKKDELHIPEYIVLKPYAKSVDTDALKRAVFTLGGFTDVYTEVDTFENELTEEDYNFYFDVIFPKAQTKVAPFQLYKQITMLNNKSFLNKLKEVYNVI